MSISDNKAQALNSAMEMLNKKLGNGTVMKMGDKPTMKIEVVPSGSFSLDEALGVGGYPKGRIIEIYGPESSGKTTMALHAVAEAQKMGLSAAFVDAEHALDPVYAENLGVNVETMIISQPDCGEDALEVVEGLVRSSAVDIIVIDSVAALTPRAEIQGDMGDSHMGLQARLMSQALRKLTGAVSQSGCIVIFINQIRMKIGVMFGNPETTTGGNALKFYASIRLDVRRRTAIKNGDAIVGNETTVKVVKNKVAPPFKVAELTILYGLGVSRPHQLIKYGQESGVIEKGGAWFNIPEMDVKVQGEQNLSELISSDEFLQDYLEDSVKEFFKSKKDKLDSDLADKRKARKMTKPVKPKPKEDDCDEDMHALVVKAIKDGRVNKGGPWLSVPSLGLKARGEIEFTKLASSNTELRLYLEMDETNDDEGIE